jgi:hypothetical protein
MANKCVTAAGILAVNVSDLVSCAGVDALSVTDSASLASQAVRYAAMETFMAAACQVAN